jgi:hypothetical protein
MIRHMKIPLSAAATSKVKRQNKASRRDQDHPDVGTALKGQHEDQARLTAATKSSEQSQ